MNDSELLPKFSNVIREEVLMQAWKKTASFIRSHNWYADVLEIDWQALRIEEFIGEIRQELMSGTWKSTPLLMIPAPKSQVWSKGGGKWQPEGIGPQGEVKIRPLAHVSLKDQVVATALMLCLADLVENEQSDPAGSTRSVVDRKFLLSYGNRLFCGKKDGFLRHRWGSQKLYRAYSSDYQRFLERPQRIAEMESKSPSAKRTTVAVVHADLSRFYDRVRPKVLARALRKFEGDSDDERAFFDLAEKVLNWDWKEPERAKAYAEPAGIEGFDRVALPQGLVASGFFSNVVLLSFDEAMGKTLMRRNGLGRGMVLLDSCRYVDDLRLVVRVPRRATEEEIGEAVSKWLNRELTKLKTGLKVENEKTVVTVRGRESVFAVPQSRAANRIQHQLSGGFDAQQGVQIINAIEGFFHTQLHYSADPSPRRRGDEGTLRGVSDLRDDTAARFAAGRFRRTFRSLRPLLDGREMDEGSSKPAQIPSLHEALLSREELDDRAHIFARGLIESWEADPAQMRLLRIAVDLHPSGELARRVLDRLRPVWEQARGGPRGARREVMIYCLSDLLRAGATETGIVGDDDVLPATSDLLGYHAELFEAAVGILKAAHSVTNSRSRSNRFPWYLMQQVLLYLAVRGREFHRLLPSGPSAGMLHRYCRLHQVMGGNAREDGRTLAFFEVIMAKGFGLRSERVRKLKRQMNATLFEEILKIAPSFAEDLWSHSSARFRKTLAPLGVPFERKRLDAIPAGMEEVCVALLPLGEEQPWHDEENLVRLAKELLAARRKNPEGVLTPWRVHCTFRKAKSGPIRDRLIRGSVKILDAEAGERVAEEWFFSPPRWCVTAEDRVRVEVGQVLRYLLTGTLDYFKPVASAGSGRGITPRYQTVVSHWQQARYGSFNGRSAFGPDWLPLSTWVETMLLDLLRWPGCSGGSRLTLSGFSQRMRARLRELRKCRGEATGMLFLEQEAPFRRKGGRKAEERPLRIAVVQSVIPNDTHFTSDDLGLNGGSIRRRHKRHIASLLQGMRQMFQTRLTHLDDGDQRRNTIDMVILPELAIHPADVNSLLLPLVRDFRCVVLAGLVYHSGGPALNGRLINSALWLIPEWKPQTGLQIRRIEQGKQHLARGEGAPNRPEIVGFRPVQWLVRYRWHTNVAFPPLILSAAVCYDATDTSLAADLRDRNDLLAICALNKDVRTFDNLAESLNYHLFQGVIIVNNGSYGGTSFFAPVRDRPQDGAKREILHFHGQPQALVGFAEISPPKLVFRPRRSLLADGDLFHFEPKGEWKEKPAGWRGPHGGPVSG